jgi:hypothetical protein
MVEDYQLDSSSISQYLQNRSDTWNQLSIDCPSVLGPSMVKVMTSVESPPQTKTFTVLGPASTALVDSESTVSSGTFKNKNSTRHYNLKMTEFSSRLLKIGCMLVLCH